MAHPSSNSRQDLDAPSLSVQVQMSDILGKAQMAVQEEVLKIDALVVALSLRHASQGLNGSEMRASMKDALAQNPYLVSMITFDRHGSVLIAEPSQIHFMEGLDLSASKNVARMLATKMHVMSEVFQPRSGPTGSAISAPAFDGDGMFIGSISTLFNVPTLCSGTLSRLAAGTGFTFTLLQLDGKIIYDSDAAQIGMNSLQGSDYASFPQLQALASRMVQESSGRGNHMYFVDLADRKVVNKECCWTTVGAHGTVWRLAIERQV